MTYTDDDLDRIIAVLEDAGDEWESIAAELPEVRTYESAHGSARAVVELDAPSQSNVAAGITDKYALLYRSEAGEGEDEDGRPISWPATWHPVGWSNASPGARVSGHGRESFDRATIRDGARVRLELAKVNHGGQVQFQAAAITGRQVGIESLSRFHRLVTFSSTRGVTGQSSRYGAITTLFMRSAGRSNSGGGIARDPRGGRPWHSFRRSRTACAATTRLADESTTRSTVADAHSAGSAVL